MHDSLWRRRHEKLAFFAGYIAFISQVAFVAGNIQ